MCTYDAIPVHGELVNKNSYCRHLSALGLMSGTSLDGIDIALLSTGGDKVSKFGPTNTVPYSNSLRQQICATLGGSGDIASAEARLTEAHIIAVIDFLSQHNMTSDEIDLIGFHGHTIIHQHLHGKTWQIGDGQHLANQLSIDVIADFRVADMELGGEGAPLAPVFHRAMARNLSKPLCILNIGGVANLTWISTNEMVAFDTGPGNALIDDWMLRHTGHGMDRNGALAATGKIQRIPLKVLLSDLYFDRPAPKSLDRNYFSERATRALAKTNPADGAATLTAFTAQTTSAALKFLPEMPNQLLVCGGGRKNATLMETLQAELKIPVMPVESVGWDGDAMEAQLFAFLAVRSRYGLPISFPTTTGVNRPATGGRLFRAASERT